MSQLLLRAAAGLVAGGILACGTAAAAPALPWAGEHKHLGAATCGGSNCHGASKPAAGSHVRQDEYFLWERKDAHSNAYKLLLTDAGKRMAANLGLKAAHEEPACLTCHADYVPEKLRASRYQLGDGIACEGCHGGAEQWNRQHVAPGATHAGNVAAGMVPLEDPAARARVCLHCHLGSAEKPIDHRIMGAGHPPLSFELDTFTAIQPAHFDADADYRQRKGIPGSLRTWAIGQAVAAEFFLDGLLSSRFKQAGAFPELVFFDCNACHHAVRPTRWHASVAALGPGEVRLADANLAMAGHVIAAVLPEQAAEWSRALGALHEATRTSVAQVKDVAGRMRRIATDAAAAAASRPLARAQALALLDRVVTQGERKALADCTTAEQTVYAIGVVNEFLKADAAAFRGLEAPYNAAVDTVNCRRGDFNVKGFQDSLRKVREAARKAGGA
jgi:hypothetical protein